MKHEAFGHFANKSKAPRYLPDFTADSVLDIDFGYLQGIGVKHVLFDLDLTLRKHKAPQIEAAIIDYLVAQHKAGHFETLNLATNNIHDVSAFSKPLSAQVFQPFRSGARIIHKPHRLFFERILKQLHAQPHEVVMIGDKVKFDTGAGNNVGMYTILVKPNDDDGLVDRLRMIRPRERRLLRHARTSLALAKQIQAKPPKTAKN